MRCLIPYNNINITKAIATLQDSLVPRTSKTTAPRVFSWRSSMWNTHGSKRAIHFEYASYKRFCAKSARRDVERSNILLRVVAHC